MQIGFWEATDPLFCSSNLELLHCQKFGVGGGQKGVLGHLRSKRSCFLVTVFAPFVFVGFVLGILSGGSRWKRPLPLATSVFSSA